MRILIIPIFCRSVENSIYIQYICIISSKLMKTQEIARSAPRSRPRKIPRVNFPTPLHRYRNLWKKRKFAIRITLGFRPPRHIKVKSLLEIEKNSYISKEAWPCLKFGAFCSPVFFWCWWPRAIQKILRTQFRNQCQVSGWSSSSVFVTYDSMTTFANIPNYQSKIPDNNFKEYSPNKCFSN